MTVGISLTILISMILIFNVVIYGINIEWIDPFYDITFWSITVIISYALLIIIGIIFLVM